MKRMYSMFLRNWIYICIILSIAAVVFFRWLSFSIFFSGDWSFSFAESLSNNIQNISVWMPSWGLGQVNLLISRMPQLVAYSLIGQLNLGSNIADKFLVFWPIVFLTGVVSYILFKDVLRSRLAGLTASIVFSYNTYFISNLTAGHHLLNLAIIFSILSFYFYICFLRLRRNYFLIISGLMLTASGIWDFRIFYITAWLIGSYGLYAYLVNLNRVNKLSFKEFLKSQGVVFFVSLTTSLYWLVSLFKTEQLSTNKYIERSLFGNNFWSLENAFTLHHPFWVNGRTEWFILHDIPVYFWLIPILAFLGLVNNRKNKAIIYFSLVGLIGVFLTKQIDQPFTKVYPWLYTHLVGFNGFREASKFYYMIVISYAVLIGALAKTLIESKYNRFIRYLSIIGIIILFLSNTTGIITGKIKTIFEPKIIPIEYITFKNYVLNQNDLFRVLWVPKQSSFYFSTNQNPAIDLVGVLGEEWENFRDDSIAITDEQIRKKIGSFFSYSYTNWLLDSSSIKYIVVPLDDKINEDSPFKFYGKDREYFINVLDNTGYLKRVDVDFKDLVVYENIDYKKKYRINDKLISIDNYDDFNIKFDLLKSRNTNPSITDQKINIDKFIAPFVHIDLEDIQGKYINKVYSLENMDVYVGASENLNNIRINNKLADQFIFSEKGQDYNKIENLKIDSVSFSNEAYSLENIVVNGDFAKGLWNENVGDCYRYDNDPMIRMNLGSDKTKDNYLRLEAQRHIACAITEYLPIKSSSTYLLNFDFRSISKSRAGYYVEFLNDKGNNVANNFTAELDWKKLTANIQTPENATFLRIYLYSYESDGYMRNIVDYDNISLIQIPNLQKSTFLLSDSPADQSNSTIEFNEKTSTKREVAITSNSNQLYLEMSEAYDSNWVLHSKEGTKLEGIEHYKLNDNINVWHVDMNALCNQNACIKNSDGSNTTYLVIEYIPQKYFIWSIWTSLFMLMVYLAYIGFHNYPLIKQEFDDPIKIKTTN